jgi:hypothetical protein
MAVMWKSFSQQSEAMSSNFLLPDLRGFLRNKPNTFNELELRQSSNRAPVSGLWQGNCSLDRRLAIGIDQVCGGSLSALRWRSEAGFGISSQSTGNNKDIRGLATKGLI